jgi:hypothetical protein
MLKKSLFRGGDCARPLLSAGRRTAPAAQRAQKYADHDALGVGTSEQRKIVQEIGFGDGDDRSEPGG